MAASMIYYNAACCTSALRFDDADTSSDEWREPPEPLADDRLACVSWEHRIAGHAPRKVVVDGDGLEHAVDPLPRPPLKIGEPCRVPAEVWQPQ